MMSRTQREGLRRVFGAEGSRMLKLLDALDEKDVLIADLIEIATTTTPDDSPYIEYQERLAALKARAEK